MKIETDPKLDFKDVLIRPKRSYLKSRNDVSLERTIKFVHSKRVWTGVPIMTSNMDTTGTFEMYNELHKHGIITCFHKHYSVEDYPLNMDKNFYAVSTGIGQQDYEKLKKIIDRIDPYFVCVDVANGYMYHLVEFTRRLRFEYPNLTIFCGNVVTREMVEELILNSGVDVVKVGIGNGSVCTTRRKTGVGMPQLSAIMECSDAAHGVGGHIISDGGCQVVGDFGKAFGAGTDFIMSGSTFAGHTESGGSLIELPDGKKLKRYYGMSSKEAMDKHYGGVAEYRTSEGKAVDIEYKGPVINTIKDILGGIRSTCTYIGASRLKDIPKCTTFIMVGRQLNDMFG